MANHKHEYDILSKTKRDIGEFELASWFEDGQYRGQVMKVVGCSYTNVFKCYKLNLEFRDSHILGDQSPYRNELEKAKELLEHYRQHPNDWMMDAREVAEILRRTKVKLYDIPNFVIDRCDGQLYRLATDIGYPSVKYVIDKWGAWNWTYGEFRDALIEKMSQIDAMDDADGKY